MLSIAGEAVLNNAMEYIEKSLAEYGFSTKKHAVTEVKLSDTVLIKRETRTQVLLQLSSGYYCFYDSCQSAQYLPIPADSPTEPLHKLCAGEVDDDGQSKYRERDDRRGRRAFGFVRDEKHEFCENC